MKTKKIKFYIISIFPDVFPVYFNESILKKAQDKKIIQIVYTNLRKYTSDKRKTVDDTPYGGGAGMVMKVEPIFKAVDSILKKAKGRTRIILFSASGKTYKQKDAQRLGKYYDNIILICGRYEGVDARVAKYISDEEVSIGEYVLTGGEIPAMVLVDSVTRLLPGVLGNKESLLEESHNQENSLEYPQYTKPAEFKPIVNKISKTKNWKVPPILLSGNHLKIKEWRNDNQK